MTFDYSCKPTPLAKIYMYANVNADQVEKLFNAQYSEVTKSSPYYGAALNFFKRSYWEEKRDLKDLPEYPTLVGKYFKDLTQSDVDIKIKRQVAKKLLDVEFNERQKRKDYNFVQKVFDKIGHFFKGHGFRSTKEWTHELASRIAIEKPVGAEDKALLKEKMIKSFASAGDLNPSPLLEQGDFTMLNNLSRQDFLEITKPYFSGKLPGTNDNVYARLYEGVNNERKDWLLKTILKRQDWPTQLVKLGVPEIRNQDFWSAVKVSDTMITEILYETKYFFDALKENKEAQEWPIQTAAMQLVAKVVSHLLEKRKDDVSWFVGQSGRKEEIVQFLVEEPSVLTDDQVEEIKFIFNEASPLE